MNDIDAIQNRFDALAADAIEALLEKVEDENHVTAIAMKVTLVRAIGQSPLVEVNLTVQTGNQKPRSLKPGRRYLPARRPILRLPHGDVRVAG